MERQGRSIPAPERRRLRLGAILAAAVGLRLLVIDTELWFDELWSLLAVRSMPSPAGIFTQFRNDTNHHLATLWMWLLGPDRAWWTYRLPSLAAGLGSVLMAARIAGRDSASAGAWAAGALGLAHLMVLYSTEARGYALACFFALAAYDCVDLHLRTGSWRRAAGYWAACAGGLLSSLTFVAALAGLGLWSAAALLARERSPRSVARLAALQGVPAAALAAWWWWYWRQVPGLGVGPTQLGLAPALGDTAGYMLGIGGPEALQTTAALAVGAATLAAVGALAVRRDLRWLFYAGAVGAQPAIVTLVKWQALLLPRYFLVPVTFVFLLLATEIGRLWDRGRGRPALLAFASLWCAGNLGQTWLLARDGRGHYREAVRFMDEHTPGRPVVFGTMGDTRGGVMVDYFRRYLPPDRHPQMVGGRDVMTKAPEWFLNHVIALEQPVMPPVLQFRTVRYELEAQWPAHPLSGFRAGVYRRADLRAASRAAGPPGPAAGAARP